MCAAWLDQPLPRSGKHAIAGRQGTGATLPRGVTRTMAVPRRKSNASAASSQKFKAKKHVSPLASALDIKACDFHQFRSLGGLRVI